jgi:hypothetical protein
LLIRPRCLFPTIFAGCLPRPILVTAGAVTYPLGSNERFQLFHPPFPQALPGAPQNERIGQSGAIPTKVAKLHSESALWVGGQRRPTLSSVYLFRFLVADAASETSFSRSSQTGFETHFSRRRPLRFEPLFEVLNANFLLNLKLSHNNRNCRLAVAHFDQSS